VVSHEKKIDHKIGTFFLCRTITASGNAEREEAGCQSQQPGGKTVVLGDAIMADIETIRRGKDKVLALSL